MDFERTQYDYECLIKFQEEKGCWLWKKPPPQSKKPVDIINPIDGTKIRVKRKAKEVTVKERLLKGICSLLSPV